jgi:hypothetical protein
MAVPMRSTDFRSIVEPILNETFDGIYDQRSDEWKMIFREFRGTPRNYHEEPVLFGMGAAPALPDGTPVTYQSGGVLFIQRYVYQVYGLAFALTKVLVEDGDHIKIGTIYAEHLGQSMIETKVHRIRARRGRCLSDQHCTPAGPSGRFVLEPAQYRGGFVPDLPGTDARADSQRRGQQRQAHPFEPSPDRDRAVERISGGSPPEEPVACRYGEQRHQPRQIDGAVAEGSGEHYPCHLRYRLVDPDRRKAGLKACDAPAARKEHGR